jgi:ABC-type transport system involved in multi-copper enzyme maturation permease subunit
MKGELYDIYLSITFELRKHLRRKRLLIILALAVLVPLIFYATTPDTADQLASQSLRFLSILMIISAAMFAGDAISGEFESKTGLLLFSTPQSRTSIFVGKYAAALIVTFLVVSLYYVILILQTIHLFGISEIPTELAKSYLTASIYVTSVVSVVFFFSSIFKRAMASTILGFVILMLILPVISGVLTILEIEPWFIVTYSGELITSVLGGRNLFTGPGGRISIETYSPEFGTGIAIMAAYTVVGFLAGIMIANRKGME